MIALVQLAVGQELAHRRVPVLSQVLAHVLRLDVVHAQLRHMNGVWYTVGNCTSTVTNIEFDE